MQSLKKYGAWAVVTGGSSGIGLAIAAQLSAQGLNIVLVARTQESLLEAAQGMQAEHKIVVADLTTTAGHQALFKQTMDLDVGLFVHAAGIAHLGSFVATPEQTNVDLVAIHCEATVKLSKHFATTFQRRKKAGIMLVSSGLGYGPIPYGAVYGAAKGFVINFGEALSEELRPDNIDVLTIIPGATNTNMARKLGTLIDMDKLPMPLGEADDVARSALGALGRKDRIVPGVKNKIIAKAMRVLPTNMVKAQMSKMLGGALIP